MRRAVPLVVVAEEATVIQRSSCLSHQFATDAAFSDHDDGNNPHPHVAMCKPFTTVTCVITPSALMRRRGLADAAQFGKGKFKLFVTADDTPNFELLPESFQLGVVGRYVSSMEEFLASSQQEQSDSNNNSSEKIKFALLLSCSERLHNAHGASIPHAGVCVDLIQFCQISNTIPFDVLYNQVGHRMQIINGQFQSSGKQFNLWNLKDFASPLEAGKFVADMMHEMVNSTLGTIKSSVATQNHIESTLRTQWVAIAGLVVASIGWSYYAASLKNVKS